MESKIPNICPDCKNQFIQPFKCITCGAEKLYNQTIFSQARTIAALQTENEELKDVLENLMAYQNGCPLPSYEQKWTMIMKRAQEILERGI